MNPAAWGVDDGYWDASGRWHETPVATREALVAAMGGGELDEPPPPPPLWSVTAGQPEFLHGPADITLEDGTMLRSVEALPPDLPPGYHQLAPRDGGPVTRLIVTPGRCHLPPELRAWGWAVQLYAARSRSSWGIGDYGDLRRLAEWAADDGAGVLALNPLHAPGPGLPQQPSPYYPTSRCYRSPIYLRVEAVPGATEAGVDLDRLASEARALNDDRLIDRDRVWDLKREALEACFARSGDDPRFVAFLAEQGEPLQQFATYCVIAEVHGNGWQAWPAELQRPDTPAVAAFADDFEARVRFHAWLQWLIDEQVRDAAILPLIHDLAVGFDPGGADSWVWQDVLALDMRIGAPPDEFNTDGQDWGLPPFVPWKLRAAGYEPFIRTLRATLRHAGGLRVDHVMGLFRLFWLPATGGPGGYVRYPARELLDILALESHRARAFVVGEDLGTVEDEVRAELAARQVLSYRLLWFEPEPPEAFPGQALAAITTHDLPTVAGVWTGSDPHADRLRDRLRERAGVDDDASVEAVSMGAHRALARVPSQVVLATLDDGLCVPERPNMPGTVDEWPNWSLALPLTLDELMDHPHVLAVGDALAEGR